MSNVFKRILSLSMATVVLLSLSSGAMASRKEIVDTSEETTSFVTSIDRQGFMSEKTIEECEADAERAGVDPNVGTPARQITARDRELLGEVPEDPETDRFLSENGLLNEDGSINIEALMALPSLDDEENRAPATVIGTDDRNKVYTTSGLPYSGIVFILARDSSGGLRRGSGFMVRPNVCATAAHVIFDSTWRSDVYVLAGVNSSSTYNSYTLKAPAMAMGVSTNYYNGSRIAADDWAYIQLPSQISMYTNHLSIGTITSNMKNQSIKAVGYPKYALGSSAETFYMFESSGTITNQYGAELQMNADISGGQSGGALFNSQGRVVGILQGETSSYNTARGIDADLFNMYNSF